MFLRRFAADERGGSSLVETALVLPMFLALLISTFEVGILGMVSAGFDNAVVSASRRIRTGQSDMPTSASNFKKLICSYMPGSDCRKRVKVTVQQFGTGAANFGAAAAAFPAGPADPNLPLAAPKDGAYNTGTADTIVLVTATYRWPVATPFLGNVFARTSAGEVVISNRQLFKTEPYLW